MPDIEIEHLAPAALRPWATNARTHSRGQIRRIADSIRTFGFTSPVLIDEGNCILAGHGRVAAAAHLKMDAVPCLRLARMTPEAKRAYVLADNRLALDAGWDEALLAEELEALAAIEPDFDIAVTGFTLPEIDRLAGRAAPQEPTVPRDGTRANGEDAPTGQGATESGADAVRRVKEASDRCRPGDVWRLGPHRLSCGEGTAADMAACDRLIRCWEATVGERAERVGGGGSVGGHNRRIRVQAGEAG